MTPEELSKAQNLLGPWLVGSLLDVLFQGILLCQFARYFSWYPGDKPGIKLVILGLAILTSLKSIQAFALSWIQFIEYFTDLQAAVLLSYTAWWQTGNPLMVAVIGAYAQAFFCHRLYALSKRWLLVMPVALVLTFSFASVCAATYYISQGTSVESKISLWLAAHFASVLAGDVVLTILLAYFLFKTETKVVSRSARSIYPVVDLVFMTPALAAFCAMFNLIFSQIWSGDDKLVSMAFNLALPKLYVISMMWTLNSRPRAKQSTTRANFSSELDEAGRRRVARRSLYGGNRRSNAMELGAVKSVQIHTRTETTQQIDVRDMFHRPTAEDMKGSPKEDKAHYDAPFHDEL